MAEATWRALLAHAKERKWATERAPKEWDLIKQDVEEFGKAKTKTEKAEWFRDQTKKIAKAEWFRASFSEMDLDRIVRISLSDGTDSMSRRALASHYTRPTTSPERLNTVPADAVDFLVKFWNAWISATNFGTLAARYADAVDVAKSVGWKGQGDPVAVTQVALGVWRLRDHGLVANAGHFPQFGTKEFKDIEKEIASPNSLLVMKDGLDQAMISLGRPGPPLALATVREDRYAAIGRFRHAPHDVVIVEATRGKDWRVRSIGFVVEH